MIRGEIANRVKGVVGGRLWLNGLGGKRRETQLAEHIARDQPFAIVEGIKQIQRSLGHGGSVVVADQKETTE